MKQWDWTIHEKPYDLRQRLFLFACLIVQVVQFLHTRGPIARKLSEQVLTAGTSAGGNYEEADDGSSDADKLAKRKITLRKLKEASFRLRVLRRTGFLTSVHDPLINENAELIKIVAKVIHNSEQK
jgi:four helix bundle protein